MPKTKVARGAKTQFIKSHANLSAKEVVDAAAKEGLKLTTATVYNIRSVHNAKSKKHGKGHRAGSSRMPTEKGSGLVAAVHFCRVSGGIEQARKMIEALESLQLS